MTLFSHLHVHSEYSIMESTVKIDDLLEAASRSNMESIALTDKYIMSGAIEFYRKAVSRNIKPIIGCEIGLAVENRIFHLVLLAKDESGYQNLCQIVSRSCLKRDTFPVPAVDEQYLIKKSKGLIGLSACISGELSFLLGKGYEKKTRERVSRYLDIFEGDFYIEIQRYPLSKIPVSGSSLSETLISFALKNNFPIVATNNVHYLKPDDFKSYKYLYKIKSLSLKSDPVTRPVKNREHYLKSSLEMERLFKDLPQAVFNTRAISRKCNLVLELDKTVFPHFALPEKETAENRLKKLCLKGLVWRYGSSPPPEPYKRLEKELSVIKKTGFSDYFLIVADMARFARKKKIPICGKGSAAGSLVSYLLGISNIDPIKHDLYFERFLNHERSEPPDIDIDVCSKRRNEVQEYLLSKYGRDSVSRVCAFSTLKPRAALREAGRVMGLGKYDIDQIIKTAKRLKRFPSRKGYDRGVSTLSSIASKNQLYLEAFSIAKKIENYTRHLSMHPSAFIICDRLLAEKVPMILSEKGEVMSQYDMDSIKALGLLKMDLISSLSLSLISDVSSILKRKRGIDIDLFNIRYDDPRVFDLMMNGNTLCIFQLESSGIRTLARKIKPSSLNDITLLISLYRPGPQQSGMVKNFIERKFGREKTIYLHKDLEPILKDTYGIILYQEQVMRIVLKIAGYSLSEADILRKAITGLSSSEMQKQRSRFIEGSVKRGYSLYLSASIFKLISKFASYGFVKAHAAAYSEISYKISYIKAYFPAELIASILTNNSGYYGHGQYIEEARRLGINIKLPDINKSQKGFTVEDKGRSIRIPLISVKDLGLASFGAIIDERSKNGPYGDFFDFYHRTAKSCRLTKKAIENLIKIGAFDYAGLKRRDLIIIFYSLRTTNLYGAGQGRPTLNQYLRPSSSGRHDFTLEDRLKAEAIILGFCVSAFPLDYFNNELKKFKIVSSNLFPGIVSAAGPAFSGNIFIAGIIINKRIEKTRNNKRMLFCTIEDRDGMSESVFFPESYIDNSNILTDRTTVIIEGRLHYKDGNITLIGSKAIDPFRLKKIGSELKKESLRQNILAEAGSVWKS